MNYQLKWKGWFWFFKTREWIKNKVVDLWEKQFCQNINGSKMYIFSCRGSESYIWNWMAIY